MGAWGSGLYACDIAKDLKSTVSAVLKLPFPEERLVEILEETFPEASQQTDHEEHTIFWLVLADQFHKRNVAADSVFQKATEIIESGADAQLPQHLEFSEAEQKKRAKALNKLRDKLSEPVANKPRKTINKPQPLLMNLGDVFVYPIVETGGCFNPYFAKAKWDRAAWSAATIITCGHVFEYLAYYCPIVITSRLNGDDPPNAADIHNVPGWRLGRPGTCSSSHFKRMQLQIIDRVQIDPAKLAKCFPDIRHGSYAAINDISISNWLNVGSMPQNPAGKIIGPLTDITS